MQNCLTEARLGRSAARHLETLAASDCLTREELDRCIKRIRAGFDAVLGAAPEPTPPARGPFAVIRGGRHV